MRILLLLCVSLLATTASAANLWFYEWREAPTGATRWAQSAFAGGRHWVATEFTADPYPGQLKLLAQSRGFERATVIFSRPVSQAIGGEYAELAQAWKTQGIQAQFRFVGSLPTEDEARTLEPVCATGAQIIFLTNQLPTPYEAANLLKLKTCVEVDLALGRYPRWEDTKDLKPLKGLPLTFVNNYFPAYAHVDNLNLLETPVRLWVTDGYPDDNQVALLNLTQRLSSLYLELKVSPAPEQYTVLEKLDRSHGARLALRWAFGQPGEQDLRAWEKLGLDRLQLSLEAFRASGLEKSHERLKGEILVETFDLGKAPL